MPHDEDIFPSLAEALRSASTITAPPLTEFLPDENIGGVASAPEDDDELFAELTQRLFSAIDAPTERLPAPQDLGAFGNLLIGLASATNPQFAQSVGLPILAERRNFPLRQAAFSAQQEDERLRRVQALASLLGVREDRAQRRLLTQLGLDVRSRNAATAERRAGFEEELLDPRREDLEAKTREREANIGVLSARASQLKARVRQILQDLRQIPQSRKANKLQRQIQLLQRDLDRLTDPILGGPVRGQEAEYARKLAEINEKEAVADDLIRDSFNVDDTEEEEPEANPRRSRSSGRPGLEQSVFSTEE